MTIIYLEIVFAIVPTKSLSIERCRIQQEQKTLFNIEL